MMFFMVPCNASGCTSLGCSMPLWAPQSCAMLDHSVLLCCQQYTLQHTRPAPNHHISQYTYPVAGYSTISCFGFAKWRQTGAQHLWWCGVLCYAESECDLQRLFVCSDEGGGPVNNHVVALTNAIGPVDGLIVCRWIPIRVHYIRGNE